MAFIPLLNLMHMIDIDPSPLSTNPHANLAPALPVALLPALSSRPRSSSSACTTRASPTMLAGPPLGSREMTPSWMLTRVRPAMVRMLPRSPTCLADDWGAEWSTLEVNGKGVIFCRRHLVTIYFLGDHLLYVVDKVRKILPYPDYSALLHWRSCSPDLPLRGCGIRGCHPPGLQSRPSLSRDWSLRLGRGRACRRRRCRWLQQG